MAYEVGDVVLVHFPFREDPSKTKLRPAVIIDEGNFLFVLVQITSTNRSDKLKGKWVPKNSKDGIQMGIRCDSFVNYTTQVKLDSRFIIRKIGKCPFVGEIMGGDNIEAN